MCCVSITDPQKIILTKGRKGVGEGQGGVSQALRNMEKPKQCSKLELLWVSKLNTEVGRNLVNITKLSSSYTDVQC